MKAGNWRKPLGGLLIILNAVFGRECPLKKNARLVATAIARRMGRQYEFQIGVPQLMLDSNLGKTAVLQAIKELCKPGGILEKERGGPGTCNRYRVSSSLMPRNLDALKPGNPFALASKAVISKSDKAPSCIPLQVRLSRLQRDAPFKR